MRATRTLSIGLPFSLRPVGGLVLVLLLAACSSGNNNNNASDPASVAPFQELIDQGVARYLGMYSPMSTTRDGDVTNYQFGTGDGPLCLTGEPYTMATRDEGTEDLMIFLQGGGACWFDLCAATEEASPGIPALGILDPALAGNPLAGISTVYLPYCDGGIFASDADVDTNNDGSVDRYHRGLRNLSAALDVAVSNFPAPKRIVLAGVSAGGYGTLFALPLVRHLYPGVPIEVLNDSGIGINRPNDPAWNQRIIDYWNIGSFFPASCPECNVQGSPAGIINWQLHQDPNVRLGMLSYIQDFTIGTFFLGIGGPVFEGVLRPTMADVEAANPERMRSFLRAGTSHTFMLGDLSLSVENVSVSDWITNMLSDVPANWHSVSE
ncbi:MAG: pectin acetylesterase-family hydrolase [Halioglobus sp.]